jgi:hypothetical protein
MSFNVELVGGFNDGAIAADIPEFAGRPLPVLTFSSTLEVYTRRSCDAGTWRFQLRNRSMRRPRRAPGA